MNSIRRHSRRVEARWIKGLTLVELMIAMTLGLIVMAGVASVTLANRQVYNTNEAISQVQESIRTAFELLSYDIRQAGSNGCNPANKFANAMKPVSTQQTENWWQSSDFFRGYEGNATTPGVAFTADANAPTLRARVAGTDAIQIHGASTDLDIYVTSHNAPSAQFQINATNAPIAGGDVLMVCDFKQTAIFQVTNYNPSNKTVVHNSGTGTPGNCTNFLGGDNARCDGSSAIGFESHSFANNQTFLFRPTAVTWYIGHNGRPEDGGRSLYQISLQHRPATGLQTLEIASGVTDMQLRYRTRASGGFVTAETINTTYAADWTAVDAVEVTLTVQSAARGASTSNANQGRLTRQFTTVVALRNRVE